MEIPFDTWPADRISDDTTVQDQIHNAVLAERKRWADPNGPEFVRFSQNDLDATVLAERAKHEYQSHVLAKLWEIVRPSEDSDYDTNNFYGYAREGAQAKKRLAEGERAIKEFLTEQTEKGVSKFDDFLSQCKAAQVEAGTYHADLEAILPVLSKSPLASAVHNNASVQGYILRVIGRAMRRSPTVFLWRLEGFGEDLGNSAPGSKTSHNHLSARRGKSGAVNDPAYPVRSALVEVVPVRQRLKRTALAGRRTTFRRTLSESAES